MMRALFLLAASCLLLAGCTDADWSNTMASLGLGDSAPEQDMSAPQPAGSSWLGTGARESGASRSGAATAAARAAAAAPARIAPARAAAGDGAAVTTANDELCRASASDDADRNAFDAETRQRVYRLRYAQCRTLLAH
jgi:hypothetical protein